MVAATRKTKAKKSCKKFTRKGMRFGVDLSKDTRVLMMYIAYRRYHDYKIPLSPEEILRDATAYLGDEHYVFGMELKALADCEGLRQLSMVGLKDVIRKSATKKYRGRPSPPFPAGPLCGYMLEGNDGRVYKSERVGGSCVWKQTDLPMPYN
jgi:hypothetical protein